MIKKYLLSIFALLFCIQIAQSQVLISLLFGDKLNSDKIKFGLEGGVNFANVTNLETATVTPNFNIGFYFDFKLKNSPNWFLHSGVIIKSTMGANLEPY
ncbi:MAG: PorT family protein, partial [Eudoraea sp.]